MAALTNLGSASMTGAQHVTGHPLVIVRGAKAELAARSRPRPPHRQARPSFPGLRLQGHHTAPSRDPLRCGLVELSWLKVQTARVNTLR
jgi:hypothetical protein